MRIIPIFLIGIGLLTACTTEPDRPDLSPKPVCDEACNAATDCAAGKECCTDPAVCGADHRCVAAPTECNGACVNDADCGGGFCVAATCVECRADTATKKFDDCKGNANGTVCGPEGLCGGCLSDATCVAIKAPAGNRCAALAGDGVYQCVCAEDAHCKGNDGLNTCRAEGCVCTHKPDAAGHDKGCPQGPQVCDSGACRVCATDAHCLEYEDGDLTTLLPTKCMNPDLPTSFCGCAADAECKSGHCDEKTGTCLACVTDADCGAPAADACSAPTPPHCQVATGTCVGCTKDTECADGTVCAEDLGVCVGCTADKECPATAFDKAAGRKEGRCVNNGTPDAVCGCGSDADCGDGQCNADTGSCQQCVTGAHCEKLKLGSICSPEGTCACDEATECGAMKSAPKLEWVCE